MKQFLKNRPKKMCVGHTFLGLIVLRSFCKTSQRYTTIMLRLLSHPHKAEKEPYEHHQRPTDIRVVQVLIKEVTGK
jgi:hypothetical protein